MSKIAKISTIKRENRGSQLTMENSLLKKGLTRTPGTGVFKFPYKEGDGKYRTGLDPDATYIKKIQDKVERDLEKERVTDLKKKLEEALQVDLGVRSTFWNFSRNTGSNDTSHGSPVKLQDGDNFFDLSNPKEELAFAWLRVHPTIAPSLQAWERGDCDAETQFYVVDDEIENKVIYNKKQAINKAIIKFDSFSPEKKKKIARMLGLSVDGDTREDVVYNLVDDLLKQTEFKSGKHKGLDPIRIFNQFADMKENLLHIKDLVKQAITHSIYRVKNDKVFEGEAEIAKDEDELVKFLTDEENQDDLLKLEKSIKTKMLLSI